jgi:hypothetical protein
LGREPYKVKMPRDITIRRQDGSEFDVRVPDTATPQQIKEHIAAMRTSNPGQFMAQGLPSREEVESLGRRAEESVRRPSSPAGTPDWRTLEGWSEAATMPMGGREPFRLGRWGDSYKTRPRLGGRTPRQPAEVVSDLAGKYLPRSIAPAAAGILPLPLMTLENAADLGIKSATTPIGLITAGTAGLGGAIGRIVQQLQGLGMTAHGVHEATKPRPGPWTVDEAMDRLAGLQEALGGGAMARYGARSLPAPLRPEVIEKTAQAVNPGADHLPKVRELLNTALDEGVAHGQQAGMKITSRKSLGDAVRGMANKNRDTFSGLIDRIRDNLVGTSQLPGYQGGKVDSNTTTIGQMASRLHEINDTLWNKFEKPGLQGQAMLGAESAAALNAERQALRTQLYEEMGKRLGLDPKEIARVNQLSGAGANLAEWLQWSADEYVTQLATARNAPPRFTSGKGMVLDKAGVKVSGMRGSYADREIRRLFDAGPHRLTLHQAYSPQNVRAPLAPNSPQPAPYPRRPSWRQLPGEGERVELSPSTMKEIEDTLGHMEASRSARQKAIDAERAAKEARRASHGKAWRGED